MVSQPEMISKSEAQSTSTSQMRDTAASSVRDLPTSSPTGDILPSQPKSLPTSQADAVSNDQHFRGRSGQHCECSEGLSDDHRARSTEPDRNYHRSEEKRSSFEVRVSPVVRGHDSGFEILRPGTFGPLLPPGHQRYKAQRRSRSHEAPRTLQKRRRKSNDSTRSFEKGRRSWTFAPALV